MRGLRFARPLFVLCLSLVFLLSFASPAPAGCFGRVAHGIGRAVFGPRHSAGYSYSYQERFSASAGCATGNCAPAPSFAPAAPIYSVPVAPAAPAYELPQAPATTAPRYRKECIPGAGCRLVPVTMNQAAPATNTAQLAAAPALQPAAAPAYDNGFLANLNAIRARHGLPPVGHDPLMYSHAAANNRHQRWRGLGHFFMGAARRQNAALGQWNEVQVLNDWMNSPGHRDALLDPTIRLAAVHRDGPAWTFSAR